MESSKAGSSGGSSGGNGSQQLLESWHERKESVNLRDLLKVKDDDSNNHHPKPSGLTLGDALNDQRNSSRTLYDIIRDDNKDKKSWKNFKDKLRLRHGGSAWTSSVHIPASDVPMQPNNNNYYNNSNTSSNNNRIMMMRRPSTRLNVVEEDGAPSAPANGVEVRPEPSSLLSSRSMARLGSTRGAHLNVSSEGNAAAAADEEDEVAEGEEGEGEGETTEEGEAAAEGRDGIGRMSLLDLLSETDRSMGIDGSSFMMDDEDDEEDESGGGVGGGEYSNCCVCMVRHKGAAFIPCGHTFCRLCSRELWVQRGNCPLCNNFILEILDIF